MGTWEPDPLRFPNGLKPVSDKAAENGIDLLLWFEPERVIRDSRLDKEHPEWLLKTRTGIKPGHLAYRLENNSLLNLGDPGCLRWLTDHISKLISENGVKIYRQDFNFPPLQYWRDNEDEQRQGINENFYVQGLLQFWDELLDRHPDLWIDSCSAGGRRNDMETMRRSVPLTYSDYGLVKNLMKLKAHNVLASWIPYYAGINYGDDWRGEGFDRYTFHCSVAPFFSLAVDIRDDDYDYKHYGEMLAIWEKAAELILHGDYYPHTSPEMDAGGHMIRQFHDPAGDRGFIQCITHPESGEKSIVLRPMALGTDTAYIFDNLETGERFGKSGGEMAAGGFTLALSGRDACIWFYEAKIK